MSWQWVQRKTIFAVHDKQLAAHAGLAGIKDLNAVESALRRTQNLDADGNSRPDVADLAAASIYGIATSHGFSDRNKRTAWVIGRLFWALNGQTLVFDQVAAGDLPEPQVADWFR